jgi:iron-sulfur cluster repair protein YtfE (RIC family)
MPSISDFMSQDHASCHELYASAEQAVASAAREPSHWEQAAKKSGRLADSLARHFAMEEEVLFPAFEDATGMAGGGPPAVMRMEHAQMRQLLDRLGQAVAARDAAQWLSVGETLLVMMQQHDMKEESILYPMTDDVLARESGEVVARLAEVRDR